MMLGIAVYSAGYALELASTSLAEIDVWNKLSYLGIAALPFTVFAFALEYSGRDAWLTRTRAALLASVPLAVILLRLTNGSHGMIYASMHLSRQGSLVLLQFGRGAFYWVNVTYTYSLLIASAGLLLQFLMRTEHIYFRQVRVVLLGMAGPWVTSALYQLGWNPWPNLDLTPLGFAVSSVAIAWSLFKLGWLDLVPVAHTEIVRSLDDAVLVLDPLGRAAYLNPSAERLFGRDSGAWQGQAVQELVRGWPALVQWLNTGEGSSTELTKEGDSRASGEASGDGGPRVYDARVSRIVHQRDELVGRVVALRDFTKHKRAEEERDRLEARLSQAQRMEAIGLLAGGVAHEFNNLLTVILGRAELAREQAGLSEEVRDDLSTIHRAGTRAGELTRQLLAYGCRQNLVRHPLSLNALIEDLAPQLRSALGPQIGLDLHLSEPVGLVCSDAGALRQMLMNLTLNARDAMPQGGFLRMETAQVDGTMASAPAAAGDVSSPRSPDSADLCVRLSVADTGLGMDDEARKHLFEPFYTTKEFGRGTGLGLPVVYGIVTQHGGWIDVQSAPDQGTRFEIFLPVAANERRNPS